MSLPPSSSSLRRLFLPIPGGSSPDFITAWWQGWCAHGLGPQGILGGLRFRRRREHLWHAKRRFDLHWRVKLQVPARFPPDIVCTSRGIFLSGGASRHDRLHFHRRTGQHKEASQERFGRILVRGRHLCRWQRSSALLHSFQGWHSCSSLMALMGSWKRTTSLWSAAQPDEPRVVSEMRDSSVDRLGHPGPENVQIKAATGLEGRVFRDNVPHHGHEIAIDHLPSRIRFPRDQPEVLVQSRSGYVSLLLAFRRRIRRSTPVPYVTVPQLEFPPSAHVAASSSQRSHSASFGATYRVIG